MYRPIPFVHIIGIHGQKQSGKDTIGNFLISNYGYKRLAFADNLKESLIPIFRLNQDQLHGHLKEVVDDFWKCTPRDLFTHIGTELYRETLPKYIKSLNQDIWIKSLYRYLLDLIDQGHTKFVVTDVRFQNEADFIQALGGTIWTVHRNKKEEEEKRIVYNTRNKKKQINSYHPYSKHKSETSIIHSDLTIYNNDTIDQLYKTVDDLYHKPSFINEEEKFQNLAKNI